MDTKNNKKMGGKSTKKVPDMLPKRTLVSKEYVILLAIFLLALFFRASLDPGIPFHYDPGKNIVYARAALDSFPLFPQYNPYFNLGEYYEYQVLFPYTVAALHILTGFSLIDLSAWLAIISGSALCLTVYFFTREVFNDSKAALISAFLIATSNIQFLAYMNYYPQILAMTLMPVAGIFIIRSVRGNGSFNLLLAAIISGLIVLASFLAAAVYFIIVLVSLALWSISDKNAVRTLIAVPLMTVVLLTFFWLPMIWRHGLLKFISSMLSIFFTPTASPFTNQPFTLMSFLYCSSVAFIVILIGIGILFFQKKVQWNFEKVLLSVWFAVSLLLMGSYLFRPLLWVDRYIQLFDIALCVLAGGLFILLIRALNTSTVNGRSAHRGYCLLLLLFIPLYSAVTFDVPFGRCGYPSDIETTEYLQSLPDDSLVVAPSGIYSFWVSAESGTHVLGGDPSQMIDHRYLGNSDSDSIINDPNLNRKMELIRKYGVNYIVLPIHKQAETLWNPRLDREGIMVFDNAEYFEVAKINNDDYGLTMVLKVRENLTPRYLLEERNNWITVLGYCISVSGLLGFVYFARRNKGESTVG